MQYQFTLTPEEAQKMLQAVGELSINFAGQLHSKLIQQAQLQEAQKSTGDLEVGEKKK